MSSLAPILVLLAFCDPSSLASLLPCSPQQPLSHPAATVILKHKSVHIIVLLGTLQWIPSTLRIKSKLYHGLSALNDLSSTNFSPHVSYLSSLTGSASVDLSTVLEHTILVSTSGPLHLLLPVTGASSWKLLQCSFLHFFQVSAQISHSQRGLPWPPSF